MKKFRLFKVLSIFAIAAAGAVAVGVGTKAPKVEAAEAATTTSRLVAKLGNIGKWSQDSAKLCAYLTDDSSTYWTSLQTMSSNKTLYVFDYTINFAPTKLIWVRMNPAATSGNWSQKWNQTGDLSVNDATYLQDQWDPTTYQCSQWAITGNVYTSKNSFSTPKYSMNVSTVELNDQNNPQVSGYVTLEENEEFKVVNVSDDVWSGYYGCPSALDSAFTGGSKEKCEGSSNIKCLIPGTYEFYFDTETKRTWITRQDIVDADGWAIYFNANVGCDPDGVSLPSGWSNCATQYGNLSNDAKDYIYGSKADEDGDNLARALATYDYAVAHHSTLTKFIKNSSDVVRTSINLDRFEMNTLFGNDDNGLVVSIVLISILSVSALASFYIIRKRKHI